MDRLSDKAVREIATLDPEEWQTRREVTAGASDLVHVQNPLLAAHLLTAQEPQGLGDVLGVPELGGLHEAGCLRGRKGEPLAL